MKVRLSISLIGLAAVAAPSLLGCGLGAGSQSSEVSLSVTADFGRVVIRKLSTSRPAASETAMRQLQRAFRVETSYAGRFVKSIDGRSGGSERGRPVDWFYFVNGIEADVGAADTVVHGGDAVWWDYRDWGAATHVPAVVGSWPHPFTGAIAGKRPSVQLVCPSGAGRACATVERRLSDVGVRASKGPLRAAGNGSELRVLVGTWASIRGDLAAQLVEQGPGSSGVYLRPSSDGSVVTVLNRQGEPARKIIGSVGFIAATLPEQGMPTWLVSGTDSESLEAAAQHLTKQALQHRYAVAWAGKDEISAPLGSGG